MPARRRNVTGNTSRRLSLRQMVSSFATPAAVGSPAKYAPLSAPTDEPTTKSGWIPWATNARNMPTWMAPKLPPPASTNAVFPVVSLMIRGCSRAEGTKRLSLGLEPEATGIFALRHAGLMIDLAVGKGGHQGQVELANFRILDGEVVKNAVMRRDHGRVVARPRGGCVVAQLLHDPGEF